MSDFGKILDQWDNKVVRSPKSDSVPKGGPPVDMDGLLDRYPPEVKDGDHAPDGTRARRKNPEKIKVDDSLDLHGYRLEEARAAVDAFIESSVVAGYRKVLIIHGKGENGMGVLRREIRVHLERHPMTGTMGYGRGNDGGMGALWVMLRERQAPNGAGDQRSR